MWMEYVELIWPNALNMNLCGEKEFVFVLL